MAYYKLNTAVKILRAFDKGPLGKNNPNITDEHYKALFLLNLLYGPDPETPALPYPPAKLDIKYWNHLPYETQEDYKNKRKEIIKLYKQP